MIVIDASLALDFILLRPHTEAIISSLKLSNRPLFAPEIIDIEVLQALRKQVLLKRISIEIAHRSHLLLADLPLTRHSHKQLLTRVWHLRNNFTAYDAAYVALAENLNAELWTGDAKFLGSPGHQVHVRVFLPAP